MPLNIEPDEYSNDYSLQRASVPDEHHSRKRQKHHVEKPDRDPKYNTLPEIHKESTGIAYGNL